MGMLYKYALMEGKKISKGSYHNFHLAHPILIRPMAFQRRHISCKKKNSDPEGMEFCRYSRTKIF
jgi:hypothetical protein